MTATDEIRRHEYMPMISLVVLCVAIVSNDSRRIATTSVSKIVDPGSRLNNYLSPSLPFLWIDCFTETQKSKQT